MFERFTEKAVNTVCTAQNIAKELKSSEVMPEHLLLAIISEAKGVSLKIFKMYNLTEEIVRTEILKSVRVSLKVPENIPFSRNVKEILKRTLDLASKSCNQNILFEHLFLATITDKSSGVPVLLEKLNFDIINAREILEKLVQKKIKKMGHPEDEVVEGQKASFESLYEGKELSEVLANAVSKLTTAGYEILGTEQIMASILETSNSSLIEVLNNYGISSDDFSKKLASIDSRASEYEDKKIIFTPNAFMMMNLALQTAKELGSSVITPEHIVLSILKAKKGIAYEILKSYSINEENLTAEILRPIEKQMSETLLIMKLAKEEARRIGRNTVGTEMFLLGILGEGTSDACCVLNNLEITLKDARTVVEGLIGYGNEYFDNEIVFTSRAKRVLEEAWLSAKKSGKEKIAAVDILIAITEEPDSLAMRALTLLGIDSVEIKHGILGKK